MGDKYIQIIYIVVVVRAKINGIKNGKKGQLTKDNFRKPHSPKKNFFI